MDTDWPPNGCANSGLFGDQELSASKLSLRLKLVKAGRAILVPSRDRVDLAPELRPNRRLGIGSRKLPDVSTQERCLRRYRGTVCEIVLRVPSAKKTLIGIRPLMSGEDHGPRLNRRHDVKPITRVAEREGL